MPAYLRRDIVDSLLRQLKEVLEALKSSGLPSEAVYENLRDLASGVFEVASVSGLSFEDAARAVIDALGREDAGKLVDVEAVEKAYGRSKAEEWARLVSSA
ncbi:MAG: hypothetical protein DRJ97_05120 [Thermoprotei archaeon]|nr:MAG: hypothetical protein DRJ97_05120 [Thermoprotei archaeon]